MSTTVHSVTFTSRAQAYPWARMMKKSDLMGKLLLSLDIFYHDGHAYMGKDQITTSRGASRGKPQTGANGLDWLLRTEKETWEHNGDQTRMGEIDTRGGAMFVYTFTDALADAPREGREAIRA